MRQVPCKHERHTSTSQYQVGKVHAAYIEISTNAAGTLSHAARSLVPSDVPVIPSLEMHLRGLQQHSFSFILSTVGTRGCLRNSGPSLAPHVVPYQPEHGPQEPLT